MSLPGGSRGLPQSPKERPEVALTLVLVFVFVLVLVLVLMLVLVFVFVLVLVLTKSLKTIIWRLANNFPEMSIIPAKLLSW